MLSISSSRFAVLACAINFLLFLALISKYTTGQYQPSTSFVNKLTPGAPASHDLSLGDILQKLYAPVLHPITADTYTNVNGTEYKVHSKPIWTAPLRNQIVIADVDNRTLSEYNGIFNSAPMEWSKVADEKHMNAGLGQLSAGVLSHYLYAQIHGYDYKYYHAETMPGMRSTWLKVRAMSELLKTYRFVVFIDRDAFFNHMEVPLEWLFNRWNLTEQTSIAAPLDVLFRDGNATLDAKGRRIQNNGFIIAQSSPRTQEILEAWMNCWNDIRYPGCSYWKENWGNEQSAFAEYVRYEFNREHDVLELPCEDANGYPEKGRYIKSDCNGDFVRHYWVRKYFAKPAIQNSILQPLVEILQGQMLKDKRSVIYEEKELSPRS